MSIVLKQKLSFYFDENFPKEVINELRTNRWINKKCRITSAFDENTNGRDDEFQFNYCKKKNYTLVTLDQKFWNDFDYPFIRIPGIIILSCKVEELNKIISCKVPNLLIN